MREKDRGPPLADSRSRCLLLVSQPGLEQADARSQAVDLGLPHGGACTPVLEPSTAVSLGMR